MTPRQFENTTKKQSVERVRFETRVQYMPSHERPLVGHSSDLSVGGLYLKTRLPLEIDESLRLTFSMPWKGQDLSISCHARVAWTNYDKSRRKPGYVSGVGLQFLDVKHEDLSRLSKFIDAYDEKKKMNVVCAWCGNKIGMRKGPFGTTSHGLCNQCHESLDE